MNNKILIVGGVAGGASAAARLRRLDEHAHIVMFERDSYISFANCGLPYYIGGAIQDRSKLLVQTPEAMYQRFNIDIRVESEVLAVDPHRKVVQVRSRDRGNYEETYDTLILSPGAKPLRPSLPGIESSKIYTLRNIPDTDRIKAKVQAEGTRSAVVIGGGFIGVEMAENLREAGLEVTLVESNDQVLTPFDAEIAAPLAQELEAHGVKLILGDKVQGFTEREDGGQIYVQLGSGMRLQAEMVLLAIGVIPDTDFLKDSGLALGARGHIQVNNKLETNLPHVYAVGDAVEVLDYIHGSTTAIPLAGPANKQGRIAADNAAGLNSTYKGTQGTAIIKVFGLTAAATGSNERTLQRLGVPYKTVHVHPQSHASYYPGATPISMKLLFNEEGRILGAQAVGYDGVDKRIDSLAAVIRLRGRVSDLTELELSYAPPYSSAKDPVNMLGYVAENVLAGRTEVVLPRDVESRDTASTLLIDVRTALEHENGHIPGSLLLPVDELRNRLQELDRSKEIWVYCQVGLRGYTASQILRQHGFRVKNLSGGYKTYKLAQYRPQPWHHTPKPIHVASGGESSSFPGNNEPSSDQAEVVVLDACGLCCPGPLLEVKRKLDTMSQGQVLRVTASDPGFYEDIQAWSKMTQNPLQQVAKLPNGIMEAYLVKGAPVGATPTEASAPAKDGTTMVVFSGDLDKAIAALIIANGAASSGKKVTLFFTFWGLNILRKPERIPVKKGLIGRMFGLMMPRGSRRLALSKMNMLGIGSRMIRGVMKSSNVLSLEELMEAAAAQGVQLVACQMSMDLMGITREELIDGVQTGGVGYYLGRAEEAHMNLFV